MEQFIESGFENSHTFYQDYLLKLEYPKEKLMAFMVTNTHHDKLVYHNIIDKSSGAVGHFILQGHSRRQK